MRRKMQDAETGAICETLPLNSQIVARHCDVKMSPATQRGGSGSAPSGGVIDLIALSGYYDLVSMTLNTAQVATPADGALPLPARKP